MGLARLQAAFAKTDRTGPLLNVYCTAGYPERESTGVVMRALSDAGVDIIELGMPYSDPLADGETIQASSTRALRGGITLERIFEQVAEVREAIDPPIVLMGYTNQVLRYGTEAFLDACVASGVDGMILPDLPLEIYERELAGALIARDLGLSLLVTPRTPPERIRRIDRLNRGFLYVVSSSSTTGSKASALEEQRAYFERLASMQLDSPLLIGFNIATADDLAATTEFAEGGIIGSAFIRALRDDDVAGSARRFVSSVRPQSARA